MADKDKETVLKETAMAYEMAARMIAKCETVEEAAAGLEYEAIKIRRHWGSYPIAAPGEREYRSWEKDLHQWLK